MVLGISLAPIRCYGHHGPAVISIIVLFREARLHTVTVGTKKTEIIFLCQLARAQVTQLNS